MPDGTKARTCLEPSCTNPVVGRAKTCSDKCRTARSRRQRNNLASGREVGTLVTDDAEAAAQEILREELVPVVREALTEEVLEGIRQLVGHIPAAVAEARAQLESDDEEVRAKATALIFRHTFGNKAVVPDITDKGAGELVVNFGIAVPANTDNVTVTENVDTKECDSCHVTKFVGEFEGLSNRCSLCYASLQQAARELVGETE